MAVVASAVAAGASDAPLPDAKTVVAGVNGRERGAARIERLTMTLIEAGGASRASDLIVYRRDSPQEIQGVAFFTSPPSDQGTGMLVREYATPGREDGVWLYLPGMRSARRIPPSRRGDPFFSSDFSLLEVSTDTRLRDDLMAFESLGRETVDGATCIRLSAVPLDADLAQDVGFSRAEYWIDEALWLPRRVLLYDGQGNARKRIRLEDFRKDGQVWTVWRRSAENLSTKHRTTMVTSEMRFGVTLPDSLFTEAGLLHGPPREQAGGTP